jgi:nucleoside-diphosphate-sugar epimerase
MTMGASVLVTGAGGLLGQAVCHVLQRERVPFLALMRRGGVAGMNTLMHDLTRARPLADLVKTPVSAVVHLAAAVPMSAAYPDTEQMADLTRRMDAAIFLAAQAWGCRVLYASTCGLYDRKFHRIKSEETGALDPGTPYLAAKLDGEKMFQANGDAVVMRLAALIGAGQRKSSIVSRFIETARADGAITLWGSGRRQQNFVDAYDVADFVRAALARSVPGVFNLAAPAPTSMMELAQLVVDVVGRGRIILAGVDDPNELDMAEYETVRAGAAYGWRAKTPLAQSLRELRLETFRE